MIIGSFLSAGLLILKYRNSLSISSNHSSHALPVLSWSSVGRNGSARKCLVSVVTIVTADIPQYRGPMWKHCNLYNGFLSLNLYMQQISSFIYLLWSKMFRNFMYLLQYNTSNMSTISLFNFLEMAASE